MGPESLPTTLGSSAGRLGQTFWEKTSPGDMRHAALWQGPNGQSAHSLLHLAQLHTNDQLGLGRHVLEYISLEPPQHVWPQQVV